MRSAETLLRVEGITKRFPQALANDGISFALRRGEILCLLGENGAGKSTLAEILCGACRPDAGTIHLDGTPRVFASPKDAIAVGIGMVHQHFALVPTLSAAENVAIGTRSSKTLLDIGPITRRLEELCAQYEIELDLHARISQLSVGEQQWVEILKALHGGIRLLLLDEPTAALTPQEVSKLFANLGKMRDSGLAIICITHKLDEVMDISDRVMVLRSGKVVGLVETAATSREELARLMVGRDVVLRIENRRPPPGAKLLDVTGISVLNDEGRRAVRGVSFAIRRGEILGVAGVSGNGQKELFDAMVGARPAVEGEIRLDGEDLTNRSPAYFAERGMGGIPDDRIHQGLVMDFRVDENLILGRHRHRPFAERSLLRWKMIAGFAHGLIRDYEIVPPSGASVARVLSGGNLQKVVVARELSQTPKCLIVSQPTRGLDVAATEYVHRRLLQERDRGAAILLMSEDLGEIVNLATRIAVLFRGEIVGEMAAQGASIEEIGLLMAGVRR